MSKNLLLKKFDNGDKLSDDALDVLIDMFRKTKVGLMDISDPSYWLVLIDVNTKLNIMEGYRKARRDKRK